MDLNEAKPKSRRDEVDNKLISCRNVIDRGILARTLADEVDELRGKLVDWEATAQQGHPSPCTLGSLCPYCEIDRLAADNAELLERCGLRGYNLQLETERADAAELLLRTATAENAELRWQAKQSELAMLEAQQTEDYWKCQFEAANDTLDRLREAVVKGRIDEVEPIGFPYNAYAILNPEGE